MAELTYHFHKTLKKQIQSFSFLEFGWCTGMEEGPDRIERGTISVYEIFDDMVGSIGQDESRKMTKGALDAPAYEEDYLKRVWGNTLDLLELIRTMNREGRARDGFCELISDDLTNINHTGTDTKRNEYYQTQLETVIEQKLKTIDRLKSYHEYEARAYEIAASVAKMATDDDTFLAIVNGELEGLSKKFEQKFENQREAFGWWIADSVAEKGYPDPCLHDVVMTTITSVAIDAMYEFKETREFDVTLFSKPLQKMSDAYQTNAETMGKIGRALAKIPGRMKEKLNTPEGRLGH